MPKPPLKIKRKKERFYSEHSRVITKPYFPGNDERNRHIIARLLSLPEEEIKKIYGHVISDFSSRHKDINEVFNRNFDEVSKYIPADTVLSDELRLLIGAYFTHEYSIQAAAFFNPSIVISPNQNHVDKGCYRFILSFRSTGEGHISSIEFRSGILDKNNHITFDPISRYVETPKVVKNRTYEKPLFLQKLGEMKSRNEISEEILGDLSDKFTFNDLQDAVAQRVNVWPGESQLLINDTTEEMLWLARSNYDLKFSKDKRISERVIFPVSENESRGIEDARFVRFVDDNGEVTYYATYTAYDGVNILPQLLETKDFYNFKIRTLNGDAVQNKGMALFPRKVGGKYMMISRQDGENIYIMASDNPHFWHEAKLLQEPTYSWEIVQIGNCGSPMETDEGWILLTHGVGPMRRYCIGAYLLDLEDPSKVIGQLSKPLLSPTEEEREGYVPNVLYTCGAIIHNEEVIIPYSMSDTSSAIAVISVKELLSGLKA
jgi:predicted GH43/DUF377 family glycosyl hydrolase